MFPTLFVYKGKESSLWELGGGGEKENSLYISSLNILTLSMKGCHGYEPNGTALIIEQFSLEY